MKMYMRFCEDYTKVTFNENEKYSREYFTMIMIGTDGGFDAYNKKRGNIYLAYIVNRYVEDNNKKHFKDIRNRNNL